MSVHEQNYAQMKRLGILDARYKKVFRNGFMPLTIERVAPNQVSMVHYYEQNGDLMKDPELVIEFDHDLGTVQVLTCEMSALGLYQEVYVEDDHGTRTGVRPKLKKDLNAFLKIWLSNIVAQGFDISAASERA